ncbi:MAG: glycosyltransferase [Peptostreptococcaceae bacterium]
MSDLVSIIIMIYNNKSYLLEALDSVLMQNYNNLELIISDDCSNDFNDNDIQNIKDYINENQKGNIVNCIVSKNNQNIGVIKNYNKCIVLSSGKYIMYLSGDDSFYDENVVSDVVNFFKNSNYLIATSYLKAFGFGEYTTPIKNYIPDNKEYLQGDARSLYLRLCYENFIAGANTYFTRELIEKYGLYDEDYILLEDWPRYLNLSKRGCSIGLIDRYTINYRLGGVTTNNTSTISTSEQKQSIRDKISADCDIVASKEVNPYLELAKKSQADFESIAKQESDKIENIKSTSYDLICYVIDDEVPYFCEEKNVIKKIHPSSKYIKEYIDLKKFNKIYGLRIDPINARCIIKLKSIYMIKGNIYTELNVNITNSYTNYEKFYFFGDNDPQIFVDLIENDIDSLYVEYEFVSFDGVTII